MNTKYIFPLLLIILDVGAAIVYGINKDIRMATYWIAAAVLNICVTFQEVKVDEKDKSKEVHQTIKKIFHRKRN